MFQTKMLSGYMLPCNGVLWHFRCKDTIWVDCVMQVFLFVLFCCCCFGGDVLRLDALFGELRHIMWGVMGVSDLKMLCG